MSLTVTVEELKERFEELVHDAAERHEEIMVAKNGATMARVVPTPMLSEQRRRPGSAKGLFEVPDDFDDPLPDDVVELFYK